MNRTYMAPEIQVNGVTVAAAYTIEDPAAPDNLTDADVSGLIRYVVQAAVDVVAQVIIGAMPKGRPAVIRSVIRDPATGLISATIEENAVLRDVTP